MKQAIIIVVIVLAVTGLAWWMLETMDGGKKGGDGKSTDAHSFEDLHRGAGGLKVVDVKEGTGKTAKSGDIVVVHYTGRLANGTKFDSSVDRNEPFEFPLGRGKVIKGWDQGVAGMKEGGKRNLIIPPELGYGSTGAGKTIPPNAELHFEVELLKVK